MFPVSSHSKFYLYAHPVDMRKSFNGLYGVVTNYLHRDPCCGDVFMFVNKRRDRMKMLVWDKGGFWIFYKQLECGRFQSLKHTVKNEIHLSYDQIVMLLEGVDLYSVKRRKRYLKTG
jgi:transposase